MDHELAAAIRSRARPARESSGGEDRPPTRETAYGAKAPLTVGESDLEELARQFGYSLLRTQQVALASGVVPERYFRHLGAFGLAGQLRLLRSRVAVVGVGGAGGFAAELLARCGVGTLLLIDGDRVEESNLNRQLFATSATLGLPKVEAARERLGAVNPAVEVITREERLTPDNAAVLLAGCQVALDCLDSGRDRLHLQEACRKARIPLVHAALRGWRGRVMVIGARGGLEWFYRPEDTPSAGEVFAFGAPAPAVAFLAAWQVAEAVKILKGEPPRGEVFTFDLASGQAACFPSWVARLSARWQLGRRRTRPAHRSRTRKE